MNKAVVKDAMILTIITLCAGLLLGFVHEITLEPIAQANYNIQQEAYKAVFADAESFEEEEDFDTTAATKVIASDFPDDEIEGLATALDADGNTIGYVITVTSHAGYGGDITLSMGVTNDGTLNGYSITDISETAGLGMKAKEEAFYSQFENKQVEYFEVTKTGSTSDDEINAISGATITSKAVTYAVDAGLAYFNTELTQGGSANE
ncbi:RnfABCDGE type electron transport complex subunit G [Eubacterium oxidoreducens]|uniref:Ion-translocating oxidoreductase complex subunit G n=1 Tax=Eubacterium oxidoreducens TaxID=1732 RepID=A0A1G6AN11_EUBOX|nr:RnfABCDGE type electron transport complex subunit G [Eubacterium oxidoreducens]SDB09779.1 electron transport complex protein RnfG [Eubacterium oxidoreducens]